MMNLSRITIDPEICHGKPCIRGLRYPVQLLLELLSSGMTTEEILADYADLDKDDILAALAFGSTVCRSVSNPHFSAVRPDIFELQLRRASSD